MKKLTLIISLLLLTFSFSLVSAKNDNEKSNNSKANREVQVTQETDEVEESDTDEETVETTNTSPSEAAKSKVAIKKLEKVQETVAEDPKVEEEVEKEVEDVIEEQEQVQENVEDTIETIDQRPSSVKLLIGPDYKNLGQLRKEVVHTRNNIRQLEKLKERVGEDAQAAIDESIAELQETTTNLQASIGEKLEGFSLFGWLFRWMSGFDAPDEPTGTPVPTGVPTVSPEASDIPTTEPEETETPKPTSTPVDTPTPEPST